jgi:hypothetical protein
MPAGAAGSQHEERRPTAGDDAAGARTTVVAFRPRLSNRLGPRERIEASRWAEVAQPHGFSRVLIHDASADDAAFGDFLLIYESGREWASWGVARDARGFVVWRPGTGETIGCYGLLSEALEAVLTQPVERSRRRGGRSLKSRMAAAVGGHGGAHPFLASVAVLPVR